MTEFVEIKTVELNGAALDWAVTKAEVYPGEMPAADILWGKYCSPYSPSTDWSYGGPLIDTHKIWLSPPCFDPYPDEPYGWDAEIYDDEGRKVIGHSIGCQTALIAVCRAIVLAKLGETVSVPMELLPC